MTQFSLFGAAAAEPARADLDGLLLAGGQWVRSPAGARLSQWPSIAAIFEGWCLTT